MKPRYRLIETLQNKKQITILVICVLAAYLCTVAIYYEIYLQDRIEYSAKNNRSVMLSSANRLQSEIENLNSMSRLIMVNRNLTAYLKSPKPDIYIQRDLVNDLYDILTAYHNTYSLFIMRNDSGYFTTGIGVTKADIDVISSETWSEEIKAKSGGYVIKTNKSHALSTNTSQELLSLVRQVNDLDTQKPIGLLALNFTPNVLRNSYSEARFSDREFAYYNQTDEMFYSEEPQSDFENLIAALPETRQPFFQRIKRNTIYSAYEVPSTGLTLLSVEKIDVTGILSVRLIIVFTMMFVLMAALFILVRILLEKEKNVREKELSVLMEQIKPHFLYNTLSSIASIALEKQDEDVAGALETLGEFYRNFLSHGSAEIPLRTEIEIVSDYLKLQKLRFENLFDEEYVLDEQFMDCQVPKLILQPLVENSIYHGIQPKGGTGKIRVSVTGDEKNLYISIYDNGIGMSEKSVRNIMSEGTRISFGFKGTIERIQNYYNKKDVYQIKSKEGYYTEVILTLPNQIKKAE